MPTTSKQIVEDGAFSPNVIVAIEEHIKKIEREKEYYKMIMEFIENDKKKSLSKIRGETGRIYYIKKQEPSLKEPTEEMKAFIEKVNHLKKIYEEFEDKK